MAGSWKCDDEAWFVSEHPHDDDPNLRVLYALVILSLIVTIVVLWTFTRAFA